MMSPEEVLAGALNPLAQTVNQYGQAQVDMANQQLQHAMALDILSHRSAAESAQAREQAALQRGLQMDLAKQHHASDLDLAKQRAALDVSGATTLAKQNDELVRGRDKEKSDRDWWDNWMKAQED